MYQFIYFFLFTTGILRYASARTFLASSSNASLSRKHLSSFTIQFRSPAQVSDMEIAQQILFKEKMNPFFLSRDNFVVAFDSDCDFPEKSVLGFGQIRPIQGKKSFGDETVDYVELASLYVLPSYRKKGIGSLIVSELLNRHDIDCDENRKSQICLLTLAPTVPFYEPFGFRCVEMDGNSEYSIPSSMKMEYMLGSLVSKILGNEIVCMIR